MKKERAVKRLYGTPANNDDIPATHTHTPVAMHTFTGVVNTELQCVLLVSQVLFTLSHVLMTVLEYTQSRTQSFRILDQRLVAILQRPQALVGHLLLGHVSLHQT